MNELDLATAIIRGFLVMPAMTPDAQEALLHDANLFVRAQAQKKAAAMFVAPRNPATEN